MKLSATKEHGYMRASIAYHVDCDGVRLKNVVRVDTDEGVAYVYNKNGKTVRVHGIIDLTPANKGK